MTTPIMIKTDGHVKCPGKFYLKRALVSGEERRADRAQKGGEQHNTKNTGKAFYNGQLEYDTDLLGEL